MKRNIIALLRVLTFGVVITAAMFWGRAMERAATHSTQPRFTTPIPKGGSSNKIGRVIDLVEGSYIERVNSDSIADEIIPQILKKLDPHSTYLTVEEMKKASEPLQGGFEGVGITFNMLTDTIIVMSVIQGGPSSKVGVIARDRIITIDGKNVAGVNFSQDSVMSMLRGKGGTKVNIGVQRTGAKELLNIEIERGKIPVHSVPSSFIIADSIGFVKLTQFSRTTHSEMIGHIQILQNRGMKTLIVDLRGNTGGYLDQAILLSNEFLPKGELIVYTEDRGGKQLKEFSNGGGRFQDLEMVILLDEASASASEIFAGAMQDNDRATIIGRRSFGKGLVQQQFSFDDGSAVRLTVSKYYTPLGRSIQRAYTMGQSEDYYNREQRTKRLNEQEQVELSDSITYTTPKGRVLYGGGGITPDIYIEHDTIDISNFYRDVIVRNVLLEYTMNFADKYAKELNEIKTPTQLNELLKKDGDLVNNFVKYAKAKGVKAPAKEVEQSRKFLDTQLRAYIARNSAMQDNGFYYNIRPIDNILNEAIITIQEGKLH